MNDSRNELTRERRRNDELTRLLRESRDKTVEVRIIISLPVLTIIWWLRSIPFCFTALL